MSAAPIVHTATVRWQRLAGEAFTDQRYSRRHEWRFDGGMTVPGSSSPHAVRLPFTDPAAVDPEEALVAAASSCHMLWFLSLAAQAGLVVDAYEDAAEGLMGPDERGRIALTRITLRPRLRLGGARLPAAGEVDALHHAAHEACYVANSLRAEIVVESPAP